MINIYDSIAYRMNNKCPCGFEVSMVLSSIKVTVKNVRFCHAAEQAHILVFLTTIHGKTRNL